MSSHPHSHGPAHDLPGAHPNGREVEWQLASDDLGAVRRWLADRRTVDGLEVGPGSTVQIFDTYFDTDDWRFHRAGFALRVRVEEGKSEVTLKSLKSASAEVADRQELSEPLENSQSPSLRQANGPVGSRVHAVSGARELQPLFEVRTSREKFALRNEGERRPVGEIALDETTISRPRGDPETSLRRVEVEALIEPHERLQTLVDTLREGCSLESATESKFSQGLKSAGLVPARPPDFGPTRIHPSMRIDEIALAGLRRHLSDWHLHEPGARLGDDPEDLHDLRLAGRKLDAILRQFRSFLPEALLRVRPSLKQALRALGEARDLDVALSELEAFARQLPELSRTGIEPLRQHLLAERSEARARMLSVLDSPPVQHDLDELQALLTQPVPAEPRPPPALDVVPGLLGARYRKMRKGASRLSGKSPTHAYHAVRGRVKKLRYALETVAVIYGKPADEMLRALRRWQDKLGIQQDAHVASRRLQELAEAPPKGVLPETLFLMGRLAEHYSASATQARKGHEKAYRRVRRRWKALRAQLRESLPAT